MRIQRIAAAGLKGRTFDHELGAATIITGPNDAGKTAITDAVKIALLGYLPGAEHGKTNGDMLALSSASSLRVAATMADGTTAERTWTQKGKTVQHTKNDVATALQGTPLALLDASDWLAQNDKRRAAMVFSLMGLPPEESPTEISKAIIADLKLAPGQAGFTWDGKQTPQDWIEATIEAYGEAIKTAKDEVKRMEGTVQGITALALEEVTVNSAEIEEEMKRVQHLIDTTNVEAGRARSELDIARKNNAKADQAETTQAALRAAIGTAPLYPEPIEELERLIAQWSARQTELREAYAKAQEQHEAGKRAHQRTNQIDAELVDLRLSSALRPEISVDLDTLNAEIAKFGNFRISEIRQEMEACLTEEARVKGTIDAHAEAYRKNVLAAETAAKALEGHCSCPTCGAESIHWNNGFDMEDMHEVYEAESAVLQSELTEAIAALTAAKEALAQEEARIHTFNALTEQIRTGNGLLAECNQVDARIEQLTKERANLAPATEAPAMPTELSELTSKITTTQDQITRKRRQAELDNLLAQTPPRTPIQPLEENLAHIGSNQTAHLERRAYLKRLEQRSANQLADRKRLQEAQDSAEANKAKAATATDVRKALIAKREAMVTAAFGPLLKTVNRFTRGIMDSSIEYRDGELGRFIEHSWAPIRAFGGAYKAATYAGINAALGAQAPSRIVIIDEMGTIDAANKAHFIDNILAAIDDGTIEQFIGIDLSARIYDDTKRWAGNDRLTIISLPGK